MDTKQRILNLLGLAMRAQKLETGEGFALGSVRSRKAFLVFVGNDASENTRKKFIDKTSYYEVPLSLELTTAEISQAIGKNRTIITVTDKGFSEKILELLEKIIMEGEV